MSAIIKSLLARTVGRKTPELGEALELAQRTLQSRVEQLSHKSDLASKPAA
ncbi:MAG: hypothetical protein KDK89_07830 [Alphaproteobacteria bacterium]|nr:hypothetical protein [Alphaproteobacteria bacterium]